MLRASQGRCNIEIYSIIEENDIQTPVQGLNADQLSPLTPSNHLDPTTVQMRNRSQAGTMLQASKDPSALKVQDVHGRRRASKESKNSKNFK